MRKTLKNQLHKGFTLVEMMIVVLIISILVLLFIPNLGQTKDAVEKESDKAIVETMRTEIELAEFERGPLSDEEKEKLFSENHKKKVLYEKEIK